MVFLLTLAVWLGVDLYWQGSKCRLNLQNFIKTISLDLDLANKNPETFLYRRELYKLTYIMERTQRRLKLKTAI